MKLFTHITFYFVLFCFSSCNNTTAKFKVSEIYGDWYYLDAQKSLLTNDFKKREDKIFAEPVFRIKQKTIEYFPVPHVYYVKISQVSCIQSSCEILYNSIIIMELKKLKHGELEIVDQKGLDDYIRDHYQD